MRERKASGTPPVAKGVLTPLGSRYKLSVADLEAPGGRFGPFARLPPANLAKRFHCSEAFCLLSVRLRQLHACDSTKGALQRTSAEDRCTRSPAACLAENCSDSRDGHDVDPGVEDVGTGLGLVFSLARSGDLRQHARRRDSWRTGRRRASLRVPSTLARVAKRCTLEGGSR